MNKYERERERENASPDDDAYAILAAMPAFYDRNSKEPSPNDNAKDEWDNNTEDEWDEDAEDGWSEWGEDPEDEYFKGDDSKDDYFGNEEPEEENHRNENHEDEPGRPKTYQEKARELGYRQNEDGEWLDEYHESVESFRLDVEYPELADLVEESATKNGVKLYDSNYGLKKDFYDQAERLSTYPPQTIQQMFRTLGNISRCTGGTEKIIISRDEQETAFVSAQLDQYLAALPEAATAGNRDQIKKIGEILVRNCSEKLVTEDFIQSLAKGAALSQEQYDLRNRKGDKIVHIINNGIEGITLNEESGDLFGPYLETAIDLLQDTNKVTLYETKADLLSLYVGSHGTSSDVLSGFQNVIFPLLEQQSIEVLPIALGGNAYGCEKYSYGIADYTEECLISRYNPAALDRLNRIYHEIPTSNFIKFEQNRRDAVRIQGVVIGGRDFIHDERPGVHEIISAMVDYYDAKDDDKEQCRDKLRRLDQKYPYAGFLENALDLNNYDQIVANIADHETGALGATVADNNETAIDILRRLKKNAQPEDLKKPKTNFEELNRLLDQINPLVNEQTGEVRVSLDEVGPAITEFNRILLENQGKQGISPSTIQALAYLDKMSSYALRSLTSKELRDVVYDPNFREILQFSELTSSPSYDEADFTSFYYRTLREFNTAFEADGINHDQIREGWRQIGEHATENAAGLAKIYDQKASTRRFKNAVWSGNLSHELISAFERV